jgi:putative transposase
MKKTRSIKKDAKYQVFAKINKGEKIFKSIEIKNIFMNVIERSKSKFRYTLYDLKITDNNIEIIIKPDIKESLSKIMQWILSVFAINFNNFYKFNGHVWESRYCSKIIN